MRSYSQHCALAKSLDVVGDRWSLLIVRELMLGQERWSEIRDGLPGIAKNLLAERLRALEDAGVLSHDGDRYALTERGQALRPVVEALLVWGVPEMGERSPDAAFRPRWLRMVAQAHPEVEIVSLDDDHAVVRARGIEFSGPPLEVIDRLAAAA